MQQPSNSPSPFSSLSTPQPLARHAPHRKIGPDDFIYGTLLGEGAYARVLHCRLKSQQASESRELGSTSASPSVLRNPMTGHAGPLSKPSSASGSRTIDFAVKIMEKRHIKREGKTHFVMMERGVLSRAMHPCIVRLCYTFQDDEYLYIVLELCRGGELSRVVRHFASLSVLIPVDHSSPLGATPADPSLAMLGGTAVSPLEVAIPGVGSTESAAGPGGCCPLPVARFYLAQLVCALEYLHTELKVVHRDLKPENVLLTERGTLKLTDFGTARDEAATFADDRQEAFVGTAEYVSPEVLRDEPAHAPADLWALGVTAYALLTGSTPFRTAVSSTATAAESTTANGAWGAAASEYLTFQRILGYDAELTRAAHAIAKWLPPSPSTTSGELTPVNAAGTDAAALQVSSQVVPPLAQPQIHERLPPVGTALPPTVDTALLHGVGSLVIVSQRHAALTSAGSVPPQHRRPATSPLSQQVLVERADGDGAQAARSRVSTPAGDDSVGDVRTSTPQKDGANPESFGIGALTRNAARDVQLVNDDGRPPWVFQRSSSSSAGGDDSGLVNAGRALAVTPDAKAGARGRDGSDDGDGGDDITTMPSRTGPRRHFQSARGVSHRAAATSFVDVSRDSDRTATASNDDVTAGSESRDVARPAASNVQHKVALAVARRNSSSPAFHVTGATPAQIRFDVEAVADVSPVARSDRASMSLDLNRFIRPAVESPLASAPGTLSVTLTGGSSPFERSHRQSSSDRLLSHLQPPQPVVLRFPAALPHSAIDLVLSLMDTNPERRLGVVTLAAPHTTVPATAPEVEVRSGSGGSGPQGPGRAAATRTVVSRVGPYSLCYAHLKAHPFFEGIDWNTIADGTDTSAPPFVPTVTPLPDPLPLAPLGASSLLEWDAATDGGGGHVPATPLARRLLGGGGGSGGVPPPLPLPAAATGVRTSVPPLSTQPRSKMMEAGQAGERKSQSATPDASTALRRDGSGGSSVGIVAAAAVLQASYFSADNAGARSNGGLSGGINATGGAWDTGIRRSLRPGLGAIYSGSGNDGVHASGASLAMSAGWVSSSGGGQSTVTVAQRDGSGGVGIARLPEVGAANSTPNSAREPLMSSGVSQQSSAPLQPQTLVLPQMSLPVPLGGDISRGTSTATSDSSVIAIGVPTGPTRVRPKRWMDASPTPLGASTSGASTTDVPPVSAIARSLSRPVTPANASYQLRRSEMGGPPSPPPEARIYVDDVEAERGHAGHSCGGLPLVPPALLSAPPPAPSLLAHVHESYIPIPVARGTTLSGAFAGDGNAAHLSAPATGAAAAFAPLPLGHATNAPRPVAAVAGDAHPSASLIMRPGTLPSSRGPGVAVAQISSVPLPLSLPLPSPVPAPPSPSASVPVFWWTHLLLPGEVAVRWGPVTKRKTMVPTMRVPFMTSGRGRELVLTRRVAAIPLATALEQSLPLPSRELVTVTSAPRLLYLNPALQRLSHVIDVTDPDLRIETRAQAGVVSTGAVHPSIGASPTQPPASAASSGSWLGWRRPHNLEVAKSSASRNTTPSTAQKSSSSSISTPTGTSALQEDPSVSSSDGHTSLIGQASTGWRSPLGGQSTRELQPSALDATHPNSSHGADASTAVAQPPAVTPHSRRHSHSRASGSGTSHAVQRGSIAGGSGGGGTLFSTASALADDSIAADFPISSLRFRSASDDALGVQQQLQRVTSRGSLHMAVPLQSSSGGASAEAAVMTTDASSLLDGSSLIASTTGAGEASGGGGAAELRDQRVFEVMPRRTLVAEGSSPTASVASQFPSTPNTAAAAPAGTSPSGVSASSSSSARRPRVPRELGILDIYVGSYSDTTAHKHVNGHYSGGGGGGGGADGDSHTRGSGATGVASISGAGAGGAGGGRAFYLHDPLGEAEGWRTAIFAARAEALHLRSLPQLPSPPLSHVKLEPQDLPAGSRSK